MMSPSKLDLSNQLKPVLTHQVRSPIRIYIIYHSIPVFLNKKAGIFST